MMRFTSCCVAALFAAILVPPAGAQSREVVAVPSVHPFDLTPAALQDETPANGAFVADDWRAELIVWFWLSGIEGDVRVRALSADIDADFFDVLDASDSILAFSGRLEVGKGRWGLFVDGLYSDLGADDQSSPVEPAEIDATFETILIDVGLMYRIGEWTPGGDAASSPRNTTLDLYAGARYTDLKLTLDPTVIASQSRRVDWFDPIVGAKLVLPVAKHFHILASGDVGGFGVESDFTWSAIGAIGYDFTLFDHPASLYAGYRAIGQDFSEGSGANEFVWDIVQHGPILGCLVMF